jgi:hypothetical protein
VLFLATAVQAVVTHRTLYQDGGHYLVVLLQTERPTDWFWARHFAQVLTQWPLVLALRAGLEDLPACMTIQAVGLFYLTPLVALLALSLAAGDRVMQLLVLLFVGAYYLNADFGIIAESHVFAALALLASVLLMRRARSGLGGGLALTVLSFLLLRCYESTVFSGVVLALLCYLRVRDGAVEGKAAKALLGISALLFLGGAGIALDEILHPVSAANRDNLVASLRSFSWVHSGVVFVAVAGVGWFAGLRQGLVRKIGDSLFLLAAVVFALQPFLFPETIAPARHMAARVLTTLPLAVLILLASLVARGRIKLRQRHLDRALTYLLAVIVAQSVWHFGATQLWNEYLQSFRTALERHQGFVSHRVVAHELRYTSLFHWGWTEPTLSILLSPGGRVQAIFGNPALRWQPFDPTDPERLPRLEGHGVDYSAYLAALRRSPPTEGRKGAGPPPG